MSRFDSTRLQTSSLAFLITLIPILLSYLRHLHLMEFRTEENPIPGRRSSTR